MMLYARMIEQVAWMYIDWRMSMARAESRSFIPLADPTSLVLFTSLLQRWYIVVLVFWGAKFNDVTHIRFPSVT